MSFWSFFRPKPMPDEEPMASVGDADLRAVVLSDVGCVRTNNEDAARFIRPTDADLRTRRGYLAIVADGMGGHAAGEVASALAVEVVAKTYYEQNEAPDDALHKALYKANQAIWQAASQRSAHRNMGTTCTAVALIDDRFWLAHVGDSRLYHLKNGEAIALTVDHTQVRQLLDQQVITAEEALRHPDRNVLTRAMGTHATVSIDLADSVHTLAYGERLLLCSDGLYEYISPAELVRFGMASTLSADARYLIDLAKLRGGHDNLTVVLIERMDRQLLEANHPTKSIDTP
ncbi:PP2C family protein-serine/threonine phosphatase [Fibrella aquatilis]|uniref:Serine/threonine-protein phosphatase n=1 Tax=Fibrella aquatilis TaxID=2817059 RepID=A0A939G040_9BACT|nr:PP2C family serine/threonine-protein phosphatase [Fibrella aquatilis]MBO0929416.1 serine/threonine-protein phosphatase [Fibrella aquatilis]